MRYGSTHSLILNTHLYLTKKHWREHCQNKYGHGLMGTWPTFYLSQFSQSPVSSDNFWQIRSSSWSNIIHSIKLPYFYIRSFIHTIGHGMSLLTYTKGLWKNLIYANKPMLQYSHVSIFLPLFTLLAMACNYYLLVYKYYYKYY